MAKNSFYEEQGIPWIPFSAEIIRGEVGMQVVAAAYCESTRSVPS